MEAKLELLGLATGSSQLNSETVGTVSAIIGAKGKIAINANSINNGKDRMVCYLTTSTGTRHQVTISPAVTKDLRAKAIAVSDLGWCTVQLTELKSGDKALYLTYPQGSGAEIEVTADKIKSEGNRPAVAFDDTLLAL